MVKLLYETQLIITKLLGLIALLVNSISCGPARPLTDLPAEIPWSEKGLNWNDFQEVASIPGERVGALGRTTTKIYYKFSDSVIIKNDTATVTAWIYSVFLPDKSYIKSSAPRKGLLEHEQMHFDINELCARKFRQEVSEKIFPFSRVKILISEIRQKYSVERKELNDQYDAGHRDKHFGHYFWRRDMDAKIYALEKYKEPTVIIKCLFRL